MSSPDARREERFVAAEKRILLMPWGGAGGFNSHRVVLIDCSAHGLGVIDEQPMQPGDQFVVYVQLEQVTMVLYTVRHCIQQPNGTFKIGAKLEGFIGPDHKPDKVLTSLLEQRLV